MIHAKEFPFALSLLPFICVGIIIPINIQDWFHGRLSQVDGISLLVGLAIVGAWEWAIIRSVASKKRQGKVSLLGRELNSWLWAPPITFVAGIGGGLFLPGT